MHLLLVEDDLPLGNVLLRLLKPHYRVDWVRSLTQAKAHLQATEYSLLLLDLGLPDGDGIDYLTRLRKDKNTLPVLIVSARDALDERVKGLDTGADDYLVKPFEPEELLARIRVLLRRAAGQASPILTCGELSFDPSQETFHLNNQVLSLPRKEYELLSVLIHTAGKPVSRDRLIQQLYSLGNEAESNTLDVYIHALRRLLGKERIETLRGKGFRLVNL
ncbi:MAG TPA: response regulator [Marinospirillum sp.]|uniref:response regulator n=1 Tax=Marinospirillum sp. TaxID=2183934 RepID=UPI002B4A51EC|nr:response regulator [Marinospirillum sp.]HKM14705.1 response regulator [Marinospirillum sp.]